MIDDDVRDDAQLDKAGYAYWDKTWDMAMLPAPFNPYDRKLDNTFYQRVHEYFQNMMAGRKNLKILEIGCAHSIWPHYFTRYHNAQVDGLDYSETGCRKTQAMWDEQGLKGKIVCADMFNPPADLLGQYDIVMSFGVVEHFEDTAACLSACAAFVKPGGHLFTMIPNMAGILGLLQKHIDRTVYDVHVPLSRKILIAAHEAAALEVRDSCNFMSINLNVVNSTQHAGTAYGRLLRRVLSVSSKLIWIFERHVLRLPANAFTSPYILVLAKSCV